MPNNGGNTTPAQRIQAMTLAEAGISRHIQQIIEVERGNDYREGKSGGDIRPYNRTERKERYQRRKAGRRPGDSEIFQIDEVEADEEVDEEDWYIWCCGWDCNLLRRYLFQYMQICMKVH